MPTLKVIGFDGAIPRQSPTMLGDQQSQLAENVKLYSAELRYWRGSLLDQISPVATPGTIHKFYGASSYEWLTWAAQVDVVPGPLADVSDYRLYYTGDGVPKKTNYAMATSAPPYPTAWYNMGVPAPTAAPSAVVTVAGAGAATSRAYVYTYVSTFGGITEESAPSPASAIITPNTTGVTCTVGTFAAAPVTNYNITHIRIYRTVTGLATDSYEFVAQITVGTASYADLLTTAQLGEPLGTIGWVPPDAALSGLVSLPGGTLAGFVNNTVYFSEPFYAHAWPLRYALSIPYKIIGLGVFGSTVVVMTERYPYMIHGGIPGGMSMERVPIVEPCISKASITSGAEGVLYASPNGLVLIGPGQRGLITEHLYRQNEWQALSPEDLSAVMWDGKYIGVFPTVGSSALVISSSDVPALSTLNIQATAVHVDDRAADLYFADGTDDGIYQLDAVEDQPLTYEWRSKRFALPRATTFSALKVDADYTQTEDFTVYLATLAAIIAANTLLWGTALNAEVNSIEVNGGPMNGSTVVQELPLAAFSRAVQVLLYGDGVLQATFNMTSWDPVRIPPFKSRDFEFHIIGTVYVRSLTVATTVGELYQ